MVIVVAVTPGADAVSAAFELLPAPAPGLELELEPELHAATASAPMATTAMAGTRSRCDLFIECLLSYGVPQGDMGGGSPLYREIRCRPPGLAEPRAGWPAPGRPEAWHPVWMPCARC